MGGAGRAARQPGNAAGPLDNTQIWRPNGRGRAPTASPSLASSRRPSGCISCRCTAHRQARRLGARRGPSGRDVRDRLPVPGLFRPGARLAAFVAVRDRGEPGPQPDRMHIKSGAADPASAPGSALGRPARRTPGHTPCWARRSRSLNVTLGWYSAQPSSSACRYSSRPPRQGRLRAFGRDRLSPT